MPLYDYRCSACKKVTEVRHGFDDSFEDACPHCGGKLNRVFNPAPIVFKGSGFYVTDSRGKSEAKSASTESKPESKDTSAAKETPAKEVPKKEKDPAA
ncbi:MAG TPA: FmdB family zinc ribbon protein [Candidatus Rubrimentiphilum sp.]|nr:FmdB family zinc ribbon protein [Candidatus Rubrimentiphilum sp.]